MGKKNADIFSFSLRREYPNLVGHRNLSFQSQGRHSVEEKMQAQKMLDSTKEFTGELNEVGMLVSEPEPNLPYNYSSALGQHY